MRISVTCPPFITDKCNFSCDGLSTSYVDTVWCNHLSHNSYRRLLLVCTIVGSLPIRGMISTQSTADGGGRKLVPKQQQLAVVSSHVEQPSNLAELLLGITFIITY